MGCASNPRSALHAQGMGPSADHRPGSILRKAGATARASGLVPADHQACRRGMIDDLPAEDLVTTGSPGSHLELVPDVATQARLDAMLVAVTRRAITRVEERAW